MSIDSDYRLRGYSVSGRRPVATLDLSYDHDSGVYLNASATAVLNDHDHLDLLAVEGGIGYARRITGGLSLDGGVARVQYRSGFVRDRGAHYTQVYIGVTSERLSSHIYYSPDYWRSGISTLYGEVDALVARVEKVRINGHLGLLQTLATPPGIPRRNPHLDWRIGATRQFGPVELHAAVTGAGAGYFPRRGYGRAGVSAGASWFF